MRSAMRVIVTVVLCSVWSLGFAATNSENKAFLTTAADRNMTEAHLGQMAQNQASQQAVRDFGQTLSQDHSKAYSELLQLADKDHEQIPRAIDIRKDHDIQRLMHAKGASFDREFLQDEIRDHEKLLAEYKREAAHAQNDEVKNYLNEQIAVVERHLKMAKDLAKEPARHS